VPKDYGERAACPGFAAGLHEIETPLKQIVPVGASGSPGRPLGAIPASPIRATRNAEITGFSQNLYAPKDNFLHNESDLSMSKKK
jgi:hypothetical protein